MTSGAPDNLSPVAEHCEAVTSVEVVHRVSGSNVTDKLRLTPEAAGDPALALRAFQTTADYYGADNIVSSRPVSEVHCFPQQAAARKVTAFDNPFVLCASPFGPVSCDTSTPSHTYDYGGTESCTVTNFTAAVTLSCEDSNAIVTKHGDVVLTINTQNLRDDMMAKTQALRKLVGDANVLTNIHFDVVITPEQQASLVGGQAFNNIAQQIKQANDLGQPLPDIQQILNNLPEKPQNADFYKQLSQAYSIKQQRLELLAQITNGQLLSPQQVNAFYQKFVNGSRLVDRLDIEHSASALNQATDIINGSINDLATTGPTSTIYNQVKSGTQAMLATHTSQGVFDPDRTIDFALPDLSQSLTDADVEKRIAASEMMIELNEAMRDGGKAKAAVMAGPLGVLAAALSNDDMDRVWRLFDQVQASEFFFNNTNPAGTSYDIHVTPEAKALYNIDVQPNSAIAYEVINVLNTTADYNEQTGQITLNYRAIITINARAALSTDDINKALFHTEESYGVMAFLKNAVIPFGGGVVKDLWGNVKGLYWTSVDFWSDPEAWLEHQKGALVNWRQTLDVLLQQGVDVVRRWPNMTTQEKADLLGRMAAEIWLSVPNEAKQAGRLNEALEKAVQLHLEEANKGLQIMERGGIVLSEETAVELAKRMEVLEVSTLDEMVQVADGLDDFLPCSLVGSIVHSAITPAANKPPCTPAQLAQAVGVLERQAQTLGIRGSQAVIDNIVASAKAGLHPIGPNLWESRAGLKYGVDSQFGNRVVHVLNHAVDDPLRTIPHGVFDAGPRGALSVVDEGWQKVLIANNPDVRVLSQVNGVTTYEVFMNRRVGFVGGQPGAAAGHPGVEYLRIAVRNGTSEIITSFPAARKP
jgi:DNA-binding transcriptional MerR regulator